MSTPSTTAVRAVEPTVSPVVDVVVVIPVRNEEALLPRCLASVAAAIRRIPQVNARVVVVLDGCEDGSEAIARSHGVHTIVSTARRVGEARDLGVRAALAGAAVRPEAIWIANTDGDSAVPVDWLSEQLRLADAGADAVLGRIIPDRGDLSADQYERWVARAAQDSAEHVHGANLGVRASRYLEAGGFPHVAEHEDVVLVQRIRGLGVDVVGMRNARVTTSARTSGRTPGGFAGHVRDHY